jgi:DNA-directed RNA polymerase subunit H (RpoH/RPB5)
MGEENDQDFIIPNDFSLLDIKKTQIEMMMDRGYPISNRERSILSMDESQFYQYLDEIKEGDVDCPWLEIFDQIPFPEDKELTDRNILGNVYSKQDGYQKDGKTPKIKKCLVVYIDQKKGQQISKSVADSIIVMVEGITTKVKYQEFILITKIQPSSTTRALFDDLKNTSYWIFMDRELIFNVTKHVLVPRHFLLSRDESRKSRKQFSLHQQISENDPVVKYYGWSVGRMVMIIRDISSQECMIDQMVSRRVIVRATAV